jgi:mono/diheme cytochrome c family protein
MPSYAAELTEEERWAVVQYVRVLQRAMNARDTDIPKEIAR